jgi:hypothetical protein
LMLSSVEAHGLNAALNIQGKPSRLWVNLFNIPC